jgi:AcrR family transcriptional regulator
MRFDHRRHLVSFRSALAWQTLFVQQMSFYHSKVFVVKMTSYEPPWRLARARVRHDPLNRESIVRAALRVLDREGLDGLSMRRVAEELDTGPASLYAHVRNKGELLDLVLDHVMGSLRLPEPNPAHWQEAVREAGREARRVLGEHRDVARISLGRIPTGFNAVTVMERQLALLRAGGLPDRVASLAGDLLALFVGAFMYEESMGLASPLGEEATPEETLAMIREYFASLPSDQFPNITALAEEMTDPSLGNDARFEFGLEVILRGLATYLPNPEGKARAQRPAPSGVKKSR